MVKFINLDLKSENELASTSSKVEFRNFASLISVNNVKEIYFSGISFFQMIEPINILNVKTKL